ncbi:odorant receptor 63a [Leptinotarsa decemlineata]|uniref:odorant receptor 63a n=1 Tax=Leptinotarsa decemlineata TaxID=7539 RepID=UPI003D30A782
MATIGAHPEMNNSKIQKLLFLMNLAVFSVITCLVCLMLFKEDELTITDITGAIESLLLLIHGALKLLTLQLQHDGVRDMLEQTNHFWNIEEVEFEEERNEISKFLKYMKTILYYFMAFACMPTIFFCFRPFLLHERVLVFNSYIPEFVPYFIMLLVEDYAFLIIYVACVSFDIFFATLVVLTKVQFQLLNQEIRRVVAINIEADEDANFVRNKLKKCVDHHNFLLEFVKKINNTMSNAVLMYFLILIFSICVEMFLLSNRKTVKEFFKYIFYSVSLSNEFVVFYCLPSQLLTSEAEESIYYVYDSQWYENLSNTTKCIINMISLRGQRKVFITSGKFVNLSMESCLAAYKTVFSYYMFLMTMQRKDDTK